MTKISKFNDLGLSKEMIIAINQKGFEEPTEIQSLTIPVMLRDDTNIIAQAQTGTGKTAAFGLPLIEMINETEKNVQALVLVPTRELAIQVSEEINSLKGNKNIKTIPVYGGQSIDQQLRRLKKGVHIVVGTPGRLIDHLKRKTLKIKKIEHLILDEADEMLNMGFIDDMEEIFKYTNPEKRTLLFSATIPDKIKSLAHKYMDNYEFIKVNKKQITTSLTEQIYFDVKSSDKFEALCRIIDIEEKFYGLVFCRTKNNVDKITTRLIDRGYDAEAIHGDISQAQRERVLRKFRNKRINILVATDVAARGIDVNDLSHVINYSLPQDPDSYIHRIGRTGRAGKKGTAVTFITSSEYKQMMYIQRMTKSNIKKSKVPLINDILETKKKKITDDIFSMLEDNIDPNYYNWADKLLEHHKPAKILAHVLNYCFEEELDPDIYQPIKKSYKKEKQVDQHGKARLFVALGKKDKLNAKTLVKLITSKVSIRSKDISDIQILGNFSFVTVPFEKAEDIIDSFTEKDKKPIVYHAKKK